jgi:hypothetical protein
MLWAVIATSAVVVAVGLLARRVPMVGLLAAAVAILALPAAVAATRDRTAALTVLLVAIALAPLLVVPTYLFAHPMLHIDNPTDGAIDVWIDGRRELTVGPASDDEPPHVRVPFGAHRLAWAPHGAPAGMHEIDVELSPLDDHLYAPGPVGCYWVSVTAYGRASTHGTDHGPLPLTEFHHLDHVDVWFGDTPARVRAPRILGATLRVAVQRWKQCMELASIGCDPSQQQVYVECVRTIDGRSTGDCWAEATRACAPKKTSQPAKDAEP